MLARIKRLRHRPRLLVIAGIVLVAVAFFAVTAASGATQQIGPYTVTDSVTQNTTAGTTTATYTITQPSGAPDITLIDAAIQSCNTGRIATITNGGTVETGTDPDTGVPGPSIRWTDNEGDDNEQGDNEGNENEGNEGNENEGNENEGNEGNENEGNETEGPETITVSYTVQGLFDPTSEQIAIKGGGNVVSGTVMGIGCTASRASTTPGSTTGGPGGQAGNPNVLGLPVTCADRRKFRFRLHHARTARIVDVNVFVNGKRKVHKHGTNIRSVTLKRLPLGVFTVKVVAKQSTGSSITSTRKYRGCKKGRPTSKGHHRRRHR